MPTLRWLTRDDDVRAAESVPYRLLEEVPGLGYGDRDAGNMLIQGDNLEALKALLPYYAGQVRCIYIDPPYNTGSAFEHYDDNLEHSQWLAMMWPRLELLRELLAEDGSIWVSIDDREGHYLKVVMDEVFGRRRFVTTITWQQRTTRENRKVFSEDCERVLLYCKDTEKFGASRNDLPLSDEVRARYSNPDNDPRGPWQSVSLNAQGGHGTKDQFYEFVAPSGKVHQLPNGRCWLYTWPVMQEKIADNRVWFGTSGQNAPRQKKFLSEAKAGLTPNTLWLASDAGTNDEAKKETVKLFGEAVFDTPKPERLLQRILHIATNPGDLVLDSFLGSGTTAAVAQKMGRRYIGIEMGDHAVTHCAPRLQKVVDGEQGGISKAQNWQGGGGFRFYRLGPPVFTEDGQIQPDIRFPVLAAHIWFSETGSPWTQPQPLTPFLGAQGGKGYALLYNGILGDKSASGGNVLTRKTLAAIRAAMGDFTGPLTVYGERTALSDATLKAEQIEFKQTPYDVKARK
ncbi:site-specific DNA-methyltransferase [Paracoccus sp. YLB-12]|uniref:site-specific DNA-methyltransferase (adenine-specific) n=1 Tax=Paracoccus maritimus TaxID=2933292 RepID=A0ABT2KF72_9RHOB|nr:site-specific DNA-methyltransferase [Paracoccus sp. YLB-12]MCT4334520.1 site-specific DNA-methyltransferase [Paracoccus sp. YLB-12]